MSRWIETGFGRIPLDWISVSASDFCTKVTDGTHDSPKQVELGRPLITSKHIKRRVVDLESAYHISEDDYNQIIRRSRVDQWDVIVSMIGEYCGFCCVEQSPHPEYAVKNVGLLKTGDETKAKWLYYFLNSKLGRRVLEAEKSGTSQPYITLGSLRNLPIYHPANPSEMSWIVEVLSSLDDKIDLLHRQNQTLEQLAETLFRQWFVVGEHENWQSSTIGTFLTIKGGTTPSTSDPTLWDGGIPWTSPKDLSMSNSVFMRKTTKTITERGLSKIGSGLLPVNTVLLSSRAPIGYLAITEIPVAINQGYIACICDKGLSPWFTYLWSKQNMDVIINAANGSTFLEISKSTFRDLAFSVPPSKLLREFDTETEPLFKKISLNERQIETLTTLRDTLLPKLMSGEVRVSANQNELQPA